MRLPAKHAKQGKARQFLLSMMPIVILSFARLLEDERPTARSLLGGILAVGGVIGLAFSR